jgi:hypothetical protein
MDVLAPRASMNGALLGHDKQADYFSLTSFEPVVA